MTTWTSYWLSAADVRIPLAFLRRLDCFFNRKYALYEAMQIYIGRQLGPANAPKSLPRGSQDALETHFMLQAVFGCGLIHEYADNMPFLY